MLLAPRPFLYSLFGGLWFLGTGGSRGKFPNLVRSPVPGVGHTLDSIGGDNYGLRQSCRRAQIDLMWELSEIATRNA